MKNSYELSINFRREAAIEVRAMLDEIYGILPYLRKCSSFLGNWFLKGKSREEALLQKIFNNTGPNDLAISVIEAQNLKTKEAIILGMWNGCDDEFGASIRYYATNISKNSILTLRAAPDSFASNFIQSHMLVQNLAVIFRPEIISLQQTSHFDKKVFQDRPGVGWMLYLPVVLTAQQVPEAGALVPVLGKDEHGADKQLGTIIVSVIDAPFSDENPAHVRIANAIEIRLVDQDLLPRYTDL